MSGRTTLVLGASPKPVRYSHLAVRRLRDKGHAVVALGRRPGMIGDVPILQEIPSGMSIDTVTMYMNAENQKPWEHRLLELSPRRIIFNPGAENPQLAAAAESAGVEVLEACTLVMLTTGQY